MVVGDLDGSVVLPGQNYNIAFMVDTSGSIGRDPMNTIKAQLATVFASLEKSASSDNAGTVNLYLADFDSKVESHIGVNLKDPNALHQLQTVLDHMVAEGGTNYQDAFTQAAQWFAGVGGTSGSNTKNLAYFITDGKPTLYNPDYWGGSRGNGTTATPDVVEHSHRGYQLLIDQHVTVEAIGLGRELSESELQQYDSDHKVTAHVNADDLAHTILGTSVNNLPGSDQMNGGAGDDILFGDAVHFSNIHGEGYAAIQSYVEGQLHINSVTDAQVHHYISTHADEFDQSTGNDKDDILSGDEGNDLLFGQGGNDQLHGGEGHDFLFGGTGEDHVFGDAGDDHVAGGLGNDILVGGDGADTFIWQHGDTKVGTLSKDHVTDFTVKEGDKLDLSDLLDHDGTHHNNDMKSLLSAFEDSEGVHLQVKESSAGTVTQEIVLDHTSLDGLMGGHGNTASQVIDYMLVNHLLDIHK